MLRPYKNEKHIMKQKHPNIYEYNDFQKYLTDYQQARQSLYKSFTNFFKPVLFNLNRTQKAM